MTVHRHRSVISGHLLFAALGATCCLSLLLVQRSVVMNDGSPKDSEQLAALKQRVDKITPANGCTAEGRAVRLGEKLVWGSNEDKSGHPRVCYACVCGVKEAEEDPFMDCGVHECPVQGCSRKSDNPDQEHDCCNVCPTKPVTQEHPDADTAQPEIDPRVPATGDIYRSEFRHLPAGLCQPEAPLAVLAVTSTPSATEVRARFRRLYGADAAAVGLQLVFLLGRETVVERAHNDFTDEDFYETEDDGDGAESDRRAESTAEKRQRFADQQRAVDDEAARFNDIVQSGVAEHYYHLSLKTVSLLDVLRDRCSSARFVVKTDDDVLINVRLLAAEASMLPSSMAIYGRRSKNLAPDRSGLGWYSSEREWPWPEYPPFVLGNGYLISGDALAPLYRTAMRTRYHHLEDVFVTGVVAAAAGVARHNWRAHCVSGAAGVDLCTTTTLCALTHRVNYTSHSDELGDLLYGTRRADVLAACTDHKITSAVDK